MDHARGSAEAIRHVFLSRVRRARYRDDAAGKRSGGLDVDLTLRCRAAAHGRPLSPRLSDAEESRGHRRISFSIGIDRLPSQSGNPYHPPDSRRGEWAGEDHPAVIIRDILAPNPGPFTLTGTRTYLLGDSAVLDPGPAIESHVTAIREAMPKLKTILITHRHGDHAPAARPLKRATGARIVAPA